jgi:2-amino-4-hydroxy-6-hydroxymethyldihydropteridine diphosphokinase
VTTAYIALGSNLGNRLEYLRRAVRSLVATPGVMMAARSPVYETEAVAPLAQPRYLNAVIRVATAQSARALLELCLRIERQLGRQRPPGRSKAPRIIDLDLLLYGPHVIREPGLQVPHPALLERPFVRIPLAQVAEPGLTHPVNGESLESYETTPSVRFYTHAV